MGALNFVLVSYFVVQAIILWLIASKVKSRFPKYSALAAAVFLIPMFMVLQDDSALADGGGARNVVAFFWASGGILIAGATLFVQRLRYRAGDK
jgi:hypothetical protein